MEIVNFKALNERMIEQAKYIVPNTNGITLVGVQELFAKRRALAHIYNMPKSFVESRIGLRIIDKAPIELIDDIARQSL